MRTEQRSDQASSDADYDDGMIVSAQEDTDSIEKLLNSETPYAPTARSTANPRPTGNGEVAEETRSEIESSLDPSQMVYVPAHPLVRGGEIVIGHETREIGPGSSVPPVLSSEEKPVERLGAVQPWVTNKLETLTDLVGARFLAYAGNAGAPGERTLAEFLSRPFPMVRSVWRPGVLPVSVSPIGRVAAMMCLARLGVDHGAAGSCHLASRTGFAVLAAAVPVALRPKLRRGSHRPRPRLGRRSRCPDGAEPCGAPAPIR